MKQNSDEMEPVPDSENPVSDFKEALTSNHSAEKKPQSNIAYMGRKIIFFFREKLSLIKKYVEDQWGLFRRSITDSDRITKVYQVWPGKNVFFFRGRLICGPDPRGLLLTILAIILSAWIFSFYGGNQLPSRPSLIISISIVLALTVLANLILVATSDPGIIPRNDEDECEEIGTSRGNKRKAVITVNGVEVKLKYCRTCKILRPPRSCHCVVCDNCVDKFDHHCPWIGQCIGLRNYRFYVTFICSALVFFIYLFAFSCLRIHQKVVKMGNIGLVWLGKNSPETLALTVFSFAAILFVTSLIIFHLYLIVTNQTAYENFRERYVGSKNPYDKGKINNIKEVLFVPLPSSKVNFRAELTVRG